MGWGSDYLNQPDFYTAPRKGRPATRDVQRDEIREILADVYLPEGIELWLAHAERQQWSYEEALQRALNAAEGNFS